MSARIFNQAHPHFATPNERDLQRIWGDAPLRLFISHKSEDHLDASSIKQQFKKLCASCFVAHEDIEPTEEWQKDIEHALLSMDGMLILSTPEYYTSHWTNQEAGIALSLDTPIIVIRKSAQPKGFLGKYQSLKFTKNMNEQIIKHLLTKDMSSFKSIDAIIKALSESPSWDTSASIPELFKHINSINTHQEQSIVEAFNNNDQVHWCIQISGVDAYGNHRDGSNRIDKYLKQWTGRKYIITLNNRRPTLEQA